MTLLVSERAFCLSVEEARDESTGVKVERPQALALGTNDLDGSGSPVQ